MPVITASSTQIVAGTPGSGIDLFPIDQHAKNRTAMFDIDTTGQGVADPNSVLLLCKIPFGRIRIIPCLSRFKNTAGGAGRVLSFGHLGYTTSQGTIVAADQTAFGTGVDISAALGQGAPNGPVTGAAIGVVNPSMFKFDIYSREGTTITATLTGGTLPDGFKMSGLIHYIVE